MMLCLESCALVLTNVRQDGLTTVSDNNGANNSCFCLLADAPNNRGRGVHQKVTSQATSWI